MGQDCQREIELLQPLIGKYSILGLKRCKKYDEALWTRRLPRLFAHEYLRLIYPYNLQPKRMVCCLSPNLLEVHLYSDVCTFLVPIMHTQISPIVSKLFWIGQANISLFIAAHPVGCSGIVHETTSLLCLTENTSGYVLFPSPYVNTLNVCM